jgi:FkbM family methyltransferase
MRKQLFYDPLLMLERVGAWALEKRRLRKLKGTIAANLKTGHIDSLELLELLQTSGIQVIYDIGANVGTWTLLAKTCYPDAEIHAFEPLELHVRAFREATLTLAGVTVHEVALGESDGFADIHVTSSSDASSLLSLDEKAASQLGLKTESDVRVRVESLDNRIKRQGLAPPDLIKLDIQGYELMAMSGGIGALKHAKAVLLEVSFSLIYSGQSSFHEVVTFLASHGFCIEAIGHGLKLGSKLFQADVLFIKCVR